MNKKEIETQITDFKDWVRNENSHIRNILNGLMDKSCFSNKDNKTLEYRSFGNLAQTIRKNIYKLPTDIDLVVGVPRSGIIPAYMIALFMNKKCCSLDEFISEMNLSNGYRKISDAAIKKVLIVDDSLYNGQEMKRVREKVSHLHSKYHINFSVVYIRSENVDKVDFWMEEVATPRIWQWNYLNHSIAGRACFDLDGVLCVDPTREQNDDGSKYIEFIKNAKPLYIPSYEIHSIVTSRLEKYRKETEEWLKKNNVKYKNLIMLDLPSAEERRKQNCHARFKAEHYKRIDETILFVESEEKQAKEIAVLTGKKVICTSNDEIY